MERIKNGEEGGRKKRPKVRIDGDVIDVSLAALAHE